MTPDRGVVVIEFIGDRLTCWDGPVSPSSRRLSQQYRIKLNSLDVLLSQIRELKQWAGRYTRLSLCSLFFFSDSLLPVCSLRTRPFHFTSPSPFCHPLTPPPPPPALISFSCSIFSGFTSFPALFCLILHPAPLSSFSSPSFVSLVYGDSRCQPPARLSMLPWYLPTSCPPAAGTPEQWLSIHFVPLSNLM